MRATNDVFGFHVQKRDVCVFSRIKMFKFKGATRVAYSCKTAQWEGAAIRKRKNWTIRDISNFPKKHALGATINKPYLKKEIGCCIQIHFSTFSEIGGNYGFVLRIYFEPVLRKRISSWEKWAKYRIDHYFLTFNFGVC